MSKEWAQLEKNYPYIYFQHLKKQEKTYGTKLVVGGPTIRIHDKDNDNNNTQKHGQVPRTTPFEGKENHTNSADINKKLYFICARPQTAE